MNKPWWISYLIGQKSSSKQLIATPNPEKINLLSSYYPVGYEKVKNARKQKSDLDIDK